MDYEIQIKRHKKLLLFSTLGSFLIGAAAGVVFAASGFVNVCKGVL